MAPRSDSEESESDYEEEVGYVSVLGVIDLKVEGGGGVEASS